MNVEDKLLNSPELQPANSLVALAQTYASLDSSDFDKEELFGDDKSPLSGRSHDLSITEMSLRDVDAASFTAWKAFTGANIGAFLVFRPVFFTRDGPVSQPVRDKETAVLSTLFLLLVINRRRSLLPLIPT